MKFFVPKYFMIQKMRLRHSWVPDHMQMCSIISPQFCLSCDVKVAHFKSVSGIHGVTPAVTDHNWRKHCQPYFKLKWCLNATLYCTSLSHSNMYILMLRVRAVSVCTCFLLTVQRQWRSFVTWTWVTDHSHCQSGRGRTLAAGYDRGS